jgi:hypothetical protein
MAAAINAPPGNGPSEKPVTAEKENRAERWPGWASIPPDSVEA